MTQKQVGNDSDLIHILASVPNAAIAYKLVKLCICKNKICLAL